VPVEAVRWPAGGYRLAGGYRTRLTGLTGDEAEALFAAGVTGPVAELGLGGELAAARLKLLAALPSELQERATRAQRLFHLDARGWFRAEDSVPHLPDLASAVWRGCRVRIRYREGNRVVQRTIDPLGLVLKAGAWYLVAHRVAGMRVYRVSRVVSVRALEETCARPDDFELSAYWQDWSRAFEESRPRVEVKARGPKGERTLVFESFEQAVRELLRHGSDLEVLEPAELRDQVAATARQVASLYGL
jgi:predicted DNA-binding transcriptional regulator YafY